MIRRRYKPIRSVEPGMVIDQAIMDRAGRLLISGNTVLNDHMIDIIKKMGLFGIYIIEDVEQSEIEKEEQNTEIPIAIQEKYEQIVVSDRAMVNLTESVKKRVAEGVQYLYQDTTSSTFTDTTKSITQDLMKAICENNAIAVDISTLKISDEYTFKHSVDVATMSMIVAKQYGFNDKQVYEIGIAGLLHDIGKSQIPNDVLNKASRLTEEEFELMKQHSVLGYRILTDKEELSNDIKMGVLQHHEKANGAGYPMGVNSEKIAPFARIISVADIYDALVTERPYKKPFTPRDAVEMIMSMTEELDIVAMKCFLESVILYPVGTDVMLSNGERARVIENRSSFVLRPKVMGLSTGRIYDLGRDLGCANIVIL